jgi:hypothetical protein
MRCESVCMGLLSEVEKDNNSFCKVGERGGEGREGDEDEEEDGGWIEVRKISNSCKYLRISVRFSSI